jgi:hypothetical protein
VVVGDQLRLSRYRGGGRAGPGASWPDAGRPCLDGCPAEGGLGNSSPLEAIAKACAGHQFDEIIVAALPRHVSRWLRADLPHQARLRFKLPVTTIITSY